MESLEKLWSVPRYDWYEGTFTGLRIDADSVVVNAVAHWDMSEVRRVRPRNAVYTHAVEVVRGSLVILHIAWGGHNGSVHFISSGAVSHEVYVWLSDVYKGLYSVSRADVCQDCRAEGMWEYMFKESERFALNRKIKTQHVGDYLTGENGRTLYLGGKTSVTQIRIYEKGKKEKGDKNWVRLEIQVRPAKAFNKATAATYYPMAFWQQSPWAWDFHNALMKGTTLHTQEPVEGLQTVWKVPDADRAFYSMLKQYGNTLERLLEQCGDWQSVGSHIGAQMQAFREQKEALTGFGRNPYQPECNQTVQSMAEKSLQMLARKSA